MQPRTLFFKAAPGKAFTVRAGRASKRHILPKILFLHALVAGFTDELLAGVDDAVAALGVLAVALAPVGVGGVAVVALLTRVDDAVAADGVHTIALAAVAIGGVAVVTLLVRRHHAVAAGAGAGASSTDGVEGVLTETSPPFIRTM